MRVARVIDHPSYNEPSQLNYDFSLLKLSTCLTRYNDKVRPVCLPTNNREKFVGSTGTVSGWGVLREGGNSLPNILREVDLPVISNSQCDRMYGGIKITNQMICTLKSGKDSCQGDSGGNCNTITKHLLKYIG